MGLKLNIYFYTGEIMKKYTLPLCGLAISLGMVSSAMAAAVTGSQTISGTLSVPACTVSIPAEYKVPDMTITEIHSPAVYGKVLTNTEFGVLNIKNCGAVSASAINPNGNDSNGTGTGRFKYENASVIEAGKEPLLFQLERRPNKSIVDGRVGNLFRMDGSNDVVLKDGDIFNFKLVRGKSPNGNLSKEYVGNYTASLTFTFNYS